MRKRNLYSANPGAGFSSRKMTTNQKMAAARARIGGGAGGFVRRKRSTMSRLRSMNVVSSGFLGIEKKFVDYAISAVLMSSATDCTGGELDPTAIPNAALCLSAPAIGDDASSRDGKQIIGKYLEIKGTVQVAPQVNQTQVDGQESVFLAVVLDTQSNAAQLNSEDVYKNPSANAAGNMSPLRNLLFGPRFKVLKSAVMSLPIPANTYDGTNIEVGGCTRNFHWYIPLNNLKINFNSGTTGVIASVIDNSLHFIGFSQQGLALCTYNARFRFIG